MCRSLGSGLCPGFCRPAPGSRARSLVASSMVENGASSASVRVNLVVSASAAGVAVEAWQGSALGPWRRTSFYDLGLGQALASAWRRPRGPAVASTAALAIRAAQNSVRFGRNGRMMGLLRKRSGQARGRPEWRDGRAQPRAVGLSYYGRAGLEFSRSAVPPRGIAEHLGPKIRPCGRWCSSSTTRRARP